MAAVRARAAEHVRLALAAEPAPLRVAPPSAVRELVEFPIVEPGQGAAGPR